MEHWLLIDSGKSDAAFNMAVDEALLEFAPETNHAVLRFYGWTEPAASFGYFQKATEIELLTACRPIVRRPTGGGLVSHDADWTYSIVIPPSHSWYGLRAEESYAKAHRWIQSSFALLKVPVELAACCRKLAPGQCFAGYEKSDVLWLGRKIAGAAQRRTRAGLLIQGSIQPQPPGIQRSGWQNAMRASANDSGAVSWRAGDIGSAILERSRQLAAEKYRRDEYNRRR